MNAKNIIEETSPPDVITQIVNGFQYETTVEVPGPNGSVFLFTLGVLWEDETRAMVREIGFRINPQDYEAKLMEVRFETVVRAVVSVERKDPNTKWMATGDNEEETRARKKHLRNMLDKIPRTVEYLYEEYMKLSKKRDTDFLEALEDLKKSLRMPDELGSKESDLLTDLTSGVDGGN